MFESFWSAGLGRLSVFGLRITKSRISQKKRWGGGEAHSRQIRLAWAKAWVRGQGVPGAAEHGVTELRAQGTARGDPGWAEPQ